MQPRWRVGLPHGPSRRRLFARPAIKVFRWRHIRETVAFRLESELREPVATWLEDAGFDVRMEVPILGRRADLVGSRERGLTAIEMKLHRWTEAIRQAIAYQIAADHVWVAMPLAAASRAYRQRWTFEAEGVGLLAVDDHGHVRGPIRAAPSPRLLPFVREKVLETFRIHELPFQAAGGFLAPEEDALSPRDVGVRSAGFLTSGSGAALPSDSVLTTVSPNE